jgi:DNA-binding NarL/FixJ family response regulator
LTAPAAIRRERLGGPPDEPGTDSEDNLSSRSSDAIHVVVVDDHHLFRTGLQELLDGEGLDVVGAAGDGESALELVAERAPDVVLMDLDLPGLSGVEATRIIAKESPLTRVLVLTISADEESVVDAIAAGACGYLLKGTSPESLVAGIEAAVAGESVVSPAIAAKLFEHVRIEQASPPEESVAISQLSKREAEIIKLIAGGMRNAQIAEALLISPHTVRNHVANIFAKLQVHSRLEVAARAIRNGLV